MSAQKLGVLEAHWWERVQERLGDWRLVGRQVQPWEGRCCQHCCCVDAGRLASWVAAYLGVRMDLGSLSVDRVGGQGQETWLVDRGVLVRETWSEACLRGLGTLSGGRAFHLVLVTLNEELVGTGQEPLCRWGTGVVEGRRSLGH